MVTGVDGPDQLVGDEADDEQPDHDDQRHPVQGGAVPAGLLLPVGDPVTISGPSTPAVDQAVSSRPWIAPTWNVPKRSRR